MSEEKVNYMAALDAWTDVNVIAPLVYSDGDSGVEVTEENIEQVKKAIRVKTLESYKNGLKAGAGHFRGEYRQGQNQPPAKSVATLQRKFAELG